MKVLWIIFVFVLIFGVLLALPGVSFKTAAIIVAVVGGGVLTLLNPLYGLVLLTFSMLLSPELGFGAVGRRQLTIRIDDLLMIVIFFTWLAKTAVSKETAFFRITPISLPVFLYVSLLGRITARGSG